MSGPSPQASLPTLRQNSKMSPLPDPEQVGLCSGAATRFLIPSSRGSEQSGCFVQIVVGVLTKYVNFGKGWRPRLFVLRQGVLRYYKVNTEPPFIIHQS